MDKNQATGLILISLLILGYFYFFAPDPAELQKQQGADSTQTVVEQPQPKEIAPAAIPEKVVEAVPENDSLKAAYYNQKYGQFAQAASGDEETIVLENENIRVDLNSKGGRVSEVLLKEFLTHDKKPLYLLDEENNHISQLIKVNGREVDLSELFFASTDKPQVVAEQDTATVSYKLQLSDNQYIEQIYRLPGKGYQLLYDLKMVGFDTDPSSNMTIKWRDWMRRMEENVTNERISTSVNYYTADGGFEEVGDNTTDIEEETISSPFKWIAMNQQFFTASLIAENNFKSGFIHTEADENDTTFVKYADVNMLVPMSNLAGGEGNFKYYFGPNNFQVQKKVTEGFSKNVYLGWKLFSWFNRWLIIPIFNFLDKYLNNYGIIIIILVFIIKLLLSPLSYKSYVSMAKTKVLKPELDEMKKKFGDDQAKIQSEQMKLYRQVGVNPISGCIPMLLQMPIFLALFNFFPNSVELRQQSFLWAHDLSTFDVLFRLPFEIPMYGSHVSGFCILMAVSQILYTWSNNQVNAMQGPMKNMGYIMPLMFIVVLNSFAAGLTWYYFVSNIVTFGQQTLIRKFVDEDKIRKILDENKVKNKDKKKSKFQQKLEQAMKVSEEAKKKKKTK